MKPLLTLALTVLKFPKSPFKQPPSSSGKTTIRNVCIVIVAACSLLLLTVPAAAQDDPAVATGTVFEDVNGDGQFDRDTEPGLSGVAVIAVSHENPNIYEVYTTDANGDFEIVLPEIKHQLLVDDDTLPVNLNQLTTGQDAYDLTVLPGWESTPVFFGYKEVEPAVATGTVFEDVNGDGQFDRDTEPGLSGVAVIAVSHDNPNIYEVYTTDANGDFEIVLPEIKHQLLVDDDTLPANLNQLTTGQDAYDLTVLPGWESTPVFFGYKEQEPAKASARVFEDRNEDGSFDRGDQPLQGVTVLAISRVDASDIRTYTTDAEGMVEITLPQIYHTLRVDRSTLPAALNALTTGQETYGLTVYPGWTAALIEFGFRNVAPAVTTGVVYHDRNGNGIRDDGEPGFGGLTVTAESRDEAVPDIEVTTTADGLYRIEAPRLMHTVSVDETTLPFTGLLTTGVAEYDLDVSPGWETARLAFGYQEAVPATVAGTVFFDKNDNGQQDDNERGIPGVRVVAEPLGQSGVWIIATTDNAGQYSMSALEIAHTVYFDETSLPFSSVVLTTGRSRYELNIPMGWTAVGVDAGFRSLRPDETVPISGATTDPGAEQPESTPDDSPDTTEDSEQQIYDDGTIQFAYPAGWVARPATVANIPGIAVSTSEATIAAAERGEFSISPGEVLIGIQTLSAIAENNRRDIVADAVSASAAPDMYARELAESSYATTGPETVNLGNKTVNRAGAVIFGIEQRIYGWGEYVVYVSASSGEMGQFQSAAEAIIASINNVG